MTGPLMTALSSAIALAVLLNYAPVHKRFLGISYSPRLMAVWLLPLIDIVVTIYLIAGNWFGVGGQAGYMITQMSIWTAIGLSGAVCIVHLFFKKRWKRMYQHAKRFG